MSAMRFFVSNLPSDATEKQLSRLFQDYGYVERVELKTKENPFEPENVKVLAFVTLKIHPNDVNNCIDALNWEKINGTKLKVSVAKESFLERLKREREEAEKLTSADNNVATYKEPTEPAVKRNAENTRKIFTEEELTELENNDNISADLLISKKRASGSLHNGRIVIQSFDVTPLHVIEVAKKHKKKSDGKESVAEQKRKESQNKMTKQYKDKKLAIQQALSGLDAPQAKKIKFSDAEEDDEDSSLKHDTKQKSKTNIFGSDEDNEEEGDVKLKIKPELYGKKGAKLVEMQSKQSLDPRFRIDAKFVEDDDNEDADEEQIEQASKKHVTEDDERTWQMGILEQVVGTKLDTADGAQKAARKKRMLRYDPAIEEHKKLLRTAKKEVTDAVTADSVTVGKKKQRKQQIEDQQSAIAANAAPPVSKEVFYVVTDTLAESLKTRGEGFSLLNMFGSAQTQDKRANELKKVADAKILVNKLDKYELNPFKYDSSSDEEGDNASKHTLAGDEQQKEPQKKSKQQNNKIVVESFFIPHNDARLKGLYAE